MLELPRACMGGWCSARDTCARYHASATDRRSAVQRLCPPGTISAALPLVAEPPPLPPDPPAPTKPLPQTKTMAARHYPHSLCQRLRDLAARPEGVAPEDVPDTPISTVRMYLYNMTSLGQLHPSRRPNGHNILRWFACPQTAQAHQAAEAARHPIYTPRHRARPAVETRDATQRRERKPPRPAERASARVPRQGNASPRQTAAQAWASAPVVVPPGVRITYATPPQGRLAGLCPPDKPPPMRDGATDYQRHMTRYQAQGGVARQDAEAAS